MSNSNDKRTEYERYNNKSKDIGTVSDEPSSGHDEMFVSMNSSSPEQTAAYLAEMLQELQTMAVRSGHSSLSEMLEFAHREAVWRSQSNTRQSEEGEELR